MEPCIHGHQGGEEQPLDSVTPLTFTNSWKQPQRSSTEAAHFGRAKAEVTQPSCQQHTSSHSSAVPQASNKMLRSRAQKRISDDTNNSAGTQQPSSKAPRISRYDFASTYSRGRALPAVARSLKTSASSTRIRERQIHGPGPQNISRQISQPQQLVRGQAQGSNPVSVAQLRPRNPYTKENRPTWRWLQSAALFKQSPTPTAATLQNFDFAWPVNGDYPKSCYASSMAPIPQAMRKSVMPSVDTNAYTSANVTISTPHPVISGSTDMPVLEWNDFDQFLMEFNMDNEISILSQLGSVPTNNSAAGVNTSGSPAVLEELAFNSNITRASSLQKNDFAVPRYPFAQSVAPSSKGPSPQSTSRADTYDSNERSSSTNQTTPLNTPVPIDAPQFFPELLSLSTEPTQHPFDNSYNASYYPKIDLGLEPVGLGKNPSAVTQPGTQAPAPPPSSVPKVSEQVTQSVEDAAADDPNPFPDLPDISNAYRTFEDVDFGDEIGHWDRFNNFDFNLA